MPLCVVVVCCCAFVGVGGAVADVVVAVVLALVLLLLLLLWLLFLLLLLLLLLPRAVASRTLSLSSCVRGGRGISAKLNSILGTHCRRSWVLGPGTQDRVLNP